MLTIVQALGMGLLQGVTELFPISSLGHTVVLPGILHWALDTRDPRFLVFLVATHAATAFVLFVFYFKDWMHILAGLLRTAQARRIPTGDSYARLGVLLVVATIPAGIIGLLFEHQIRDLFISPISAAVFLIANGALLYGAERLRRRAPAASDHDDARIAALSFREALIVGTMQVLALIPGFSRTGATLAGGLVSGLSHADAVRFSFLLATPIIGAAAALKLPSLMHASTALLVPMLVGAITATAGAYLSVKFLTRYFHAERSLVPFALYCVLMGVTALIILTLLG